MAEQRWPDGKVICPACGRNDASFVASRKVWQCKSRHAKRTFSVKVGTIFEDSPIPLSRWLPAVWLLSSAKNGSSSYELGKAVGVTQKSAWFMLHRIRFAIDENEAEFRNLANEWRRDTMYLSSVQEIASHANYLQIIAKGQAAMPLIMRDFQKRGGEWYKAMRAIAAANHIPTPELTAADRRNSRKVEQIWIAWGKQHGYLTA